MSRIIRVGHKEHGINLEAVPSSHLTTIPTVHTSAFSPALHHRVCEPSGSLRSSQLDIRHIQHARQQKCTQTSLEARHLLFRSVSPCLILPTGTYHVTLIRTRLFQIKRKSRRPESKPTHPCAPRPRVFGGMGLQRAGESPRAPCLTWLSEIPSAASGKPQKPSVKDMEKPIDQNGSSSWTVCTVRHMSIGFYWQPCLLLDI
ncbi:hypothetical protein B0T21DRAFT_354459 [Apiosordaria backusii]|uniref:Uncharacterized protein n=1 Tax=Apiosordaria backusii TaxID=314023 RepID=A0AA40EXT5_9PEZI|nr:hypothetical protein B0T21DRAFT_354459 [Apiosordaria backusii]